MKNKLTAIKLRLKQKLVDREYKKNGLTDSVLDKQLAINKERHQKNISDPTKKIYENFVQ